MNSITTKACDSVYKLTIEASVKELGHGRALCEIGLEAQEITPPATVSPCVESNRRIEGE